MFDEIDRLVTAAFCRVLELDPDLPLEDAASRVETLLEHSAVTNLSELIARSTRSLKRQGVLNPNWFEQEEVRPHFFMASSRPGYLKQLVRLAEEHRAGISQYIIYGEWDTILVLHGTDEEAATLRDSLESSSTEAPLYFPTRTVLSHKYLVIGDPIDTDSALDSAAVNALVRDYDRDDLSDLRQQLLSNGRLLGPTWVSDGASPYPVVAFLGISLRGRGNILGLEVARHLTANEAIRDALTDLFEVEQGRPFHYVAKLACRTMTELDDVTTLIGSEAFSGLKLEGTTFVVANGNESIPILRRTETAARITLGVDLSPLVAIAEHAIFELPAEAQQRFSELSELQQLSVVRSVVELKESLEHASLSDESRGRFASAIASFVRECASGQGLPNLHGAIADAVIALEGTVRRLLSKLAYACLGDDPARHQTELRLPTRTISKLSMGKVVSALRIARDNPAFVEYRVLIDEATLDRLENTSSERNEWLHDAAGLPYGDAVEDARRLIVGAIEIASWAEGVIASIAKANPVPAQLALPTARQGPPGIFISHSTADGRIAERIAVGLKVFDIAAWYAEWELQPGDSIVEKIEAAIAQSDILLVLLSPNSVTSKWVRRELNSALAAQLAGQNVVVVPVLIANCDIPALLNDIFRVDLTGDFESGLIRLIEFLRGRRRQPPSRPQGEKNGGQDAPP